MSEEEPDITLAASHFNAVNAILADKELSSANLVTLAYLGGDLVTKLAVDDAQAAQLQASLLALLTRAVENPELDLLNRAAVLGGWSEVATARLEDGAALPVAQIDWARIRADEAIAQLSPYQLHAGVNNLWGVYYEIGLEDQARAALTTGIEKSRAPFYFMSGMAYVEREAGNIDEAVNWYRRAWEATANPLHRARWGTGYVLRLVQLTPENDAEISRSAAAVLADMTTQKQGLEAYQSRIERLSEALLAWSESDPARGELISGLRAQVVTACAASSSDGSTPSACSSFMKPAS
jgi:tetratricopeptide (TPR) repeat protein